MKIRHHLTDDLIMGYSSGTLPEAVNLIVATHVSLCDECRAAVESYDAVGGALVEGSDMVEVSDACLSGALDLIRNGAWSATEARMSAGDDVLPAPLADYVGGTLEDVKWRPVGMGVKQAILPTSDTATARLLYIPAGTAIPDHSHSGMELTLVLKGAFEDDDGRFARGDIEVAHEEVHHTPVADISEDCICLAVTDAPLRFKGLLPRLVQPFVKI
ncbi:ChrR family anti-sigma-E factor [Aestuariicoccus sp. MJ-SS9]|uniref:ChrR family anti-sigma-E factor n=1 Tax=Aestuariicoccus sp. MJ-SS9 TaxID=3079855 RepID=UPI002908903A|nr:ChrR family anti-sigma-E factor [Aestuariicoccus sp. MJ-SS9]MDU8910689.1 ChrR family anti-sigma-E factor [Aestuariicoccus sp. MJ-SS9]